MHYIARLIFNMLGLSGSQTDVDQSLAWMASSMLVFISDTDCCF